MNRADRTGVHESIHHSPNHCTTVNAAARCSFVTTLKTIVVLTLVCQTLP